MDVVVRVIARLPVDGVRGLTIGLQRDRDLVDPVDVAGLGELVVEAPLRAERNDDGTPNFLGPYAQGPKAGRFLYLVWRASGARLGRTKIPLGGIAWDDLFGGSPVELRVDLIDDRGGPRFATVRPLASGS